MTILTPEQVSSLLTAPVRWCKAHAYELGATRIGRFSFHSLRRYAATRLASQGVSMVLIQRILGHQQLSTTERYLGRSNEDLRATMEVLSHSQSSIYSANHSAILSEGGAYHKPGYKPYRGLMGIS